jgi:GT2 family glycosyltransferase/outer membrane protein assembly factor BamB
VKPRIAAVIANFNGGDAVAAAVASVLDQVDEIVVVDDGSTDGSTDRVERRFGDRVGVVRMGRNTGVSRSRNAGAAVTSAEILLFLDCDAMAGEGMVATLCDALMRNSALGIVAPIVLDARGDDIVQCYDATIDRWGFTFDRACGKTLSELPPEALKETFYVSCCSLVIRSEVFDAIGGFDENILFGCEDVDVCWRTRLAGYGVASVRSATCRHRGASSLGVELEGSLYTAPLRPGGYTTSAFRVTARELNTFRMMVANLDTRNLVLYLALYPPAIVAEMIGLAVIGRGRVSAAYLRAFRAMFTTFPSAFARRRFVQARRRVPDAAITRFWSRGYLKLRFLRQNGVPQAVCFALVAGALTAVLSGCGGAAGMSGAPSGARPPSGSPLPGPAQPSDWSTFANSLERQGYNANETALGAGNAAALHLQWSVRLGAAIDAQPLYAASVPIAGATHDVVYVGTESGLLDALDAQSGAVLWRISLGTLTNSCTDLKNGEYGITGTPAFDRTSGRVYVMDGQDMLHAIEMTTGREAPGWPISVGANDAQEHDYGAVTYNPANGLIYVTTASYCDDRPYQGRLVAVDASTASVVATFVPAGTEDGGGLWGMGGASIDPSTNDVYVATGNTFGATAHDAYGEAVVALTPALGVIGSNYPGLANPSLDYDFGATPMLYQPPSCPPEFTAKNKDGTLYVYDDAAIASGPAQALEMAPPTQDGQFIGVTTYSPVTNMVYVGDTGTHGAFGYGLVALAVQPDCSLALAWQANEQSEVQDSDNIAATVANGVVYSTNGPGERVFANDASSGAALWNSGETIAGPVFTPPTVTGGHVYVGAWDGTLYAFAP